MNPSARACLSMSLLPIVLMSASAHAAAKPGDLEAELVRLTQELMDAIPAGNADVWRRILTDDAMLVDEFGGEVPRTRDELVRLPGVGRKTANVVLNCAFDEETFAVDTHVFRVSNRTGLARGKTVEAVEDRLVKVVPAKYMLHAHTWLILHGRYTCKARVPDCKNCIVYALCEFKDKTA